MRMRAEIMVDRKYAKLNPLNSRWIGLENMRMWEIRPEAGNISRRGSSPPAAAAADQLHLHHQLHGRPAAGRAPAVQTRAGPRAPRPPRHGRLRVPAAARARPRARLYGGGPAHPAAPLQPRAAVQLQLLALLLLLLLIAAHHSVNKVHQQQVHTLLLLASG